MIKAKEAAIARLKKSVTPSGLASLETILKKQTKDNSYRTIDIENLKGVAGISAATGGAGMSSEARILLEDCATLNLTHADIDKVLAS